MTTTVEVQQRSLRGGGSVVSLGLSLANGLDRGVKTVDICLVVLGVVQLHDLAGDVRLERAVVVCISSASVQNREEGSELTREVGQSSLAADEGRAGHAGNGLSCAGAETGAQGGSCAKEGGRHGDRGIVL